MKSGNTLKHEFVEYIPDNLEDATMYVAMLHATIVHKCCCGCGNEVVTPLSPTDWKLIFDGMTISLYPSIGNWSFRCQSHYWIRRNKVEWARRWSQDEINAGRDYDTFLKKDYFDVSDAPIFEDANSDSEQVNDGNFHESLWQKIKKWLLQWFRPLK